MKAYPALDVRGTDTDRLYVLLDDYSPTAIEERDDGVRVFFPSAGSRDEALAALSAFDASAIDVDDEDWARRSQENLTPVAVGRIIVAPPWSVVVVKPSTGFGTGHHATTRLCLVALQELDLAGKKVLDVGTGSGVLAIAAVRLGAAGATGIDADPDALQAARETLSLNPDAANVQFELADLTTAHLPVADVVVANLTGALLIRSAAALVGAVAGGGVLVVSGLLLNERDAVAAALAGAVVDERIEENWVCLTLRKS